MPTATPPSSSIGGGQAGLAIAARLGPVGVDTLVVDRNERIGDNWRTRYHSLALHNQIHVNHLPYMPFPPTWPKYIPKDMLANWFEYYAGAMEINFWTGTEFIGAHLRRGGATLDRRAVKKLTEPSARCAPGISSSPTA